MYMYMYIYEREREGVQRMRGCKDIERGLKKHAKRYFTEYDALVQHEKAATFLTY